MPLCASGSSSSWSSSWYKRAAASADGRNGMIAIGLGEDERDRAEYLGAVAECPGDDGRRLRGGGERGARERLADAVEQQLACLRQIAAHDQQLRVEHVHERGGGLADRPP